MVALGMAQATRRGRRRAAHPALFSQEELALRRTGQARWRGPARRPALPPSERQRRLEEDQSTMRQLRQWGLDLAREFGLRFKSIDRECDGVVQHYGICYEDGVIRIRLRHARTGRLLKQSSLVDTLCHELAHLRHFDHSLRFRRLYERILRHARGLGYYRPGPEKIKHPAQLGLFADHGCATRRGTSAPWDTRTGS